jgi:molybdate transport system substrate-binding protein
MRRLTSLTAAGLLAVACGSTAAAPGQGSPQPLSGNLAVFAAASLTDSFKALGDAFHEQYPGVTFQFNFAGTPTLVTQIEQGAQADVFASADTANMDRVQSAGLIAGTPRVFARNQLEIAVGPGNPKGINGLQDLSRPGVVYISAGPTVPAGKYAAQALAKAGVTVTPRSLETDVKSVLGKIELGEADAGIVYTTDVKAAGARVQGVPIPDADNVVATYPIATLKASPNFAASEAFIAFVMSAQGQAKLESFGFLSA